MKKNTQDPDAPLALHFFALPFSESPCKTVLTVIYRRPYLSGFGSTWAMHFFIISPKQVASSYPEKHYTLVMFLNVNLIGLFLSKLMPKQLADIGA